MGRLHRVTRVAREFLPRRGVVDHEGWFEGTSTQMLNSQSVEEMEGRSAETEQKLMKVY